MTIVITGGSGFIGTKLTERLIEEGHMVIVIDILPPRLTNKKLFFIQCDLSKQQLPFNVLEQTDAVINLAGKNILGKWNDKYKEEIKNTRVESTKHVVESMKSATNRPTVLINASAVGFYGDKGDESVNEKSIKGEGFLADLVDSWEKEAFVAEDFGTRVVCIRTAPVLGSTGILPLYKKMAKFGFLLKLTSKNFWQPWIHEEDLINCYLFALETVTLQGVVNAVAPESITHNDFVHTIGTVLKRRILGTVPEFISKFSLRDLFKEITKSQKVVPQRLIDKGFAFSYPKLEEAIRNLK
jgi:uncharacterized protein (TIGR01777 family)